MPSQTVVLSVRMSCEGCSGAVRRVLSKMEGVESFDIDMKQQKVTVKGNVEPEAVLQTVAKTGKKSSFWEEEVAPDSKPEAETEPAVKTKAKTETTVETEAEAETKEKTETNATEDKAETETKEETEANAAEVEVEIETPVAKTEAKATEVEVEVEGETTPPVQTEKTMPEEAVVVTTA